MVKNCNNQMQLNTSLNLKISEHDDLDHRLNIAHQVRTIH